ncbi:MAG: ParB/RepB/Spo0J family partition protein [Deltaproteobacteria bacterium]
MANYVKGNLYQISIVDFKRDPDQPRKVIDPDALAELASSIAKFGILQPLLFREADQGYVYIVAGERRYQAAQQAGLLVLPAICVTGDYAEIALIENLQRQDLTAVEEAEALLRLKNEQKYTDEQLSGVMGKARTTLTEMLSLNRLPPAIRNECRGDRKITKSVLIKIALKKQERGMQTAYNSYREKIKKAAEGRTKREKAPETAADVKKWLSKAVADLGAVDTSAWSEEEKIDFNQAIQEFEAAIHTLLNQ